MTCIQCGDEHVVTVMETFNWVKVVYQAPVRKCPRCKFSWTDFEKEDAEIAAIRAAGYFVDEKGNVRLTDDTKLFGDCNNPVRSL
jgi:hypothetical protein